MKEHVTIFEMGPRDGLQNEKASISVSDKIKLVDLLSDCGLSKIETGSFVSPKWVPQMADSKAIFKGIARKSSVAYTALTPNMRGYENARESSVDEVAIFASATEGFSKANLNASCEEALARFEPVCQAARIDDIPVRGYVSCVTDCPYEGKVDPVAVAKVAAQLFEMGCYEVSLGDTIGQGDPQRVRSMLNAVLKVKPASFFAGHFHDTNSRAIENIEVALESGLRVFDASVGGLGGCPYAPGAAGNVATEKVAARLDELGFETGLDMEKLVAASEFAKQITG
jgi:hydroxymethylglutaryl-CoA lyase